MVPCSPPPLPAAAGRGAGKCSAGHAPSLLLPHTDWSSRAHPEHALTVDTFPSIIGRGAAGCDTVQKDTKVPQDGYYSGRDRRTQATVVSVPAEVNPLLDRA